MKKIYLIALMISCFSFPAMAQNVSSPSVDEGAWEFNNNSTFAINRDGRDEYKQKSRIEYGLTDRLAATFSAEFKQQDRESIELEETEYRLIYKLTGDDAPINAATRLLYDLNHGGDADTVGLELLLGQKFGQWRHLLNIDTQHDVGEKSTSGVELDFAWASYYQFENFRVGGEYFWDLGNVKDNQRYSSQAHQIGASTKFNVGSVAGKDIALEFAYYHGISRAADDHVFKNEIEFEF